MANKMLLVVLCIAVALALFATPADAFGAGNIASISKVEGRNWRHGDIEDMLKTVEFLKKHKWTSMMVKRVYFGNWLRDYSQAVDVGTLKGVPSSTIRILVWVLAFMSFGYATGEFEVTEERLGVYRPEEHIDNPKDYADNQDARHFDQRLRGPVEQIELDIDPSTGMKNYIANESGGWSTSAGYIRYSFARAIHYGRMYTHGANKGREEDLCEALRCLGQGLHCLEDFGAHTNYTELALRELGHNNVFPHVGTDTMINLHGKHVYPLVTGTFGGVDFLHSVLGEATDHVTQSEVDEMQTALTDASASGKRGGRDGGELSALTGLLDKIPGTGSLIQEAISLQSASDQQASQNSGFSGSRGFDDQSDYNQDRGINPASMAGTDPQVVIAKIYPILEFRDKVVRSINGIISKIPGLEDFIEKITEKVTMFVMGLLAPYITPLIAAASEQLKQGSYAVVDSSGKHQYEVWTNQQCSDPTHSLLSKDHFSNILNEPAGEVAVAIVQYVAPRVIYAWDHPDVNEQQILDDVIRVFHHPAARDRNCEIHNNMFRVVEKWSHNYRGNLDEVLSSESVRAGRNHTGGVNPHLGGGHAHSGAINVSNFPGLGGGQQQQQGGWGQRNDPDSSAGNHSSTPQHSHSAYNAPEETFQQPQHSSSFGQQEYSHKYEQKYSQQQPPPQAPAGFAHSDPYAYPSAYQQGYEVGYQGPPQGQYGQPTPPPQQFGWGGQPPPGPPPEQQWGQPPPQQSWGGPPPQQGWEGQQQRFDEYGQPIPQQQHHHHHHDHQGGGGGGYPGAGYQ
ncbi:hypothetical protein AAFC00_006824 [Neodothiora populina]|uniref:Heterokaryon incompatibility Het-C n=1 Tax=Neodothiora populina TaxID=2781224 RepID=A0ABR3PB98_9PEZI